VGQTNLPKATLELQRQYRDVEPAWLTNAGCHYHFIFFKRSFRAIWIRFLLAFAKPFFFRGIFSAPYSFMRISHLHGF
jgi:hypothetical protein